LFDEFAALREFDLMAHYYNGSGGAANEPSP